MTNLHQNIERIKKNLANYPKAKLLVVTKNRSIEEVDELLNNNIYAIGENRIQEAEDKFSKLEKPIKKHLIGHLQKNKIKKAIELFDLIESVDSIELAKAINKECAKRNKIIPVFLQMNISNDQNKHGFSTDNFIDTCKIIVQLKNIEVQGLMTIPKIENDDLKTRKHFYNMRLLFKNIVQENIFKNTFSEISMGMSDDYQIALEEGATIVRLGTVVFK